jgi:hypothetical protein
MLVCQSTHHCENCGAYIWEFGFVFHVLEI